MAKTIHNCDTYDGNGTWVNLGDPHIFNIATDNNIKQEGIGSVSFEINNDGSSESAISISDMVSVNLSNYENTGKIRFWLYLPTQEIANIITGLEYPCIFGWGNDISNKWYKHFTTQYNGQPFIQGWNLIEIDWSIASKSGLPTSNNITFMYIVINYDINLNAVGYRLDYFRVIAADENEDIVVTQRSKKYFIKIYKPNGNYITTISDASFDGFRKQINGGLGELTFKLARKFDDFNEGNEITLNNKVEIWLSDRDTDSTGRKIYTGYISSYSPWIDGENEGVNVTCLGYATKLATSIYKNGSSVEIVHTSVDPSAIIKDVITRYRAETMKGQKYMQSGTDYIQDTGTTVSYTFNSSTFLDVLSKAVELSPAGWWWYLDENGYLKFGSTLAIPTHRFTFGRHFKKVEVVKNMENVTNDVLFMSADGEKKIFKHYNNSDSEDQYDERFEVINDGRVTIEATADEMSNAVINQKKDPEETTVVEIIDNNGSDFGYDIESIQPGNTCKFMGFNSITSKTFADVMLIKAVEYNLNSVTLELESLQEQIARKQAKASKDLQEQVSHDYPTSYPSVNVADTIGRKIILFDQIVQVLNQTNRSDLTWTDLDLSSYISDQAKGIIIEVLANDTGGYGAYLAIRKNGDISGASLAARTQVAGWIHNAGIIPCDANQVIEYSRNATGTGTLDCQINLFGYIE